jgi:hypothetical protein
MKYIGNYSDIISSSTVFDMITKTGEKRPTNDMYQYLESNEINSKWKDVGFLNMSSIEWYMYYDSDFTETISFDHLDFLDGYRIKFWAVKILPGKMFPGHIDMFKENKTVKRYWMAVEDYKWGHIFLQNNKVLQNYNSGDIFEISNEIHGAANIGLLPKLSIQIMAIR